MNAVLVLSIGIVILIVGYIFYGGWLAKQWGVDDSRPTPAHELEAVSYTHLDIVTGVSMCLFFVAAFSLWGQAAEWINASLGTDLPTKLYLGFGTMLIAHITFNIPYVILSIMPKLRQMDKNLSLIHI